jgi:hypothetical protein
MVIEIYIIMYTEMNINDFCLESSQIVGGCDCSI